MSTVDIWSEHSWGWAIQSQKDFFDEIEPHFSFAVEARALSTFLDALEEQWFRRWPLIPELIARGLLPREAASEGYVLADEQKELVEAHKTRRFKVSQYNSVFGSTLDDPCECSKSS